MVPSLDDERLCRWGSSCQRFLMLNVLVFIYASYPSY